MGKGLAAIAHMEIADPTPHRRINLVNHPVQWYLRSCPGRQLGNTVFNLSQGFLRRLDVGIVLPRPATLGHLDCEPEKVKLPLVGVDHLLIPTLS